MRPWVAAHIEELTPYVPGKPIEETERELGLRGVVKLASNENPLGPSPLAQVALAQAVGQVHLYPDGSNHHLVHRLAKHLEVDARQIFVGNGSNEIIDLLVRTFTSGDDVGLLTRGSFLMYKIALQAHGRAIVEVPMKDGFRYDLQALGDQLGSKVRIVFLANPDNPTGTAFGRGEFEKFLERVSPQTLVVIDEAYFEYVAWSEYPDGLSYARRMPNVVLLRTFSKIYGLAGLRLGYAVADQRLVAYLNRVRLPFNVSSVAQAAGTAALDDLDHVQRSRDQAQTERTALRGELVRLGVSVPESHANFLFADLGRPAQPVYEALLRRGVITRPVPGYGFPNALRISVGLREENERLVCALKEVL